MLILSEAQVAALFSRSDAFDAVDRGFRAQAERHAVFPLRGAVTGPKGLLGSMPGIMLSAPAALGAKLVTFFPGNAQHGEHTHQAVIALFDIESGRPLALMDGRLITELRTAAASAVATRSLAADSARTLAILGTGVQGGAHARALAAVMPLDEVRVWGRNRLHAEKLANELREEGRKARAFDTVEQACADAAIICTTTSSSEVILERKDVCAGAHINAVGACTPTMREISADLMAAASIFVDSIDGALKEAGDIILAMNEGALPAAPRLTLLADAIADRTIGRASPEEITLFKSLGIAIEDVACAALVYERAVQRGIGTSIDL